MTKQAQEKNVTVIIPNYNGAAFLEDCLTSVFRSSIDPDVIVVDDGSTDNSADIVRKKFPQVTLISTKKNSGFAAAVNRGIHAATTPFVFLLNNDATVSANTMEILLRVMETGRFFSAQPLMLQKNAPEKVDSAGDFYNALGHAFARGKDRDAASFKKRRIITSACAGAAMYHRTELERMGAFDEAHGSYLEDVDLGIRARLQGRKSVFVPEALVYHVGSGTSGSRHNAYKVRLSAANNLYLIYKNFPLAMLLLNLPLLMAGTVMKAAFFWRKGLFGAYLAGLLDGVNRIRDNKDKKAPFHAVYLPHYLMFQAELLRNMGLRLLEG